MSCLECTAALSSIGLLCISCQNKMESDLLISKRSLNKPEPMSISNSNLAIWDLVEKDIKERDSLGLFKYKTRLQGFNGRDALKDAYQEALDLSVYLRQAIFERDGR